MQTGDAMSQLDNPNGVASELVPTPKPRETARHEFIGIVLDESDPFERAIADIVSMNRRKRQDYALDGNMFSNFEQSAQMMGVAGFGIPESILHMMAIKQARLRALRENGRMYETKNETVDDTYLDLAVYACILYAWIKQQADKANGL